jgi:hypothetical protein
VGVLKTNPNPFTLPWTFFSVILIPDWFELIHESKEDNAINFVSLEMLQAKV